MIREVELLRMRMRKLLRTKEKEAEEETNGEAAEDKDGGVSIGECCKVVAVDGDWDAVRQPAPISW